MSESFRLLLAQELKARGWSQREFSKQSGISQPLISQTLSGDVPVSADFCIRAAITLEKPPATFLKLAGIIPPTAFSDDSPLSKELADTPTLQEILELARLLPPEQQEELLRFARFLKAK